MQEQDRPRRQEDDGPGPGGLGTMFGDDDAGAGIVTITHGLHQEQLPLANNTVGQIRSQCADRLDIGDSRAQLDGNDVGDDVVVRPGQHLMFVHRAGEKG